MKMAGYTSGPRSSAAGFLTGWMLLAGVCSGATPKGGPSKTGPSKVTAVRFWSLGQATRVAVEVSSEFRYKSERLSEPDRLFFDIQGARPEMISKGMHLISVGDGLLKQIRVAETQPGITRVVLDVEPNVAFTASQLSSPDRLMIELRLKDRPAPPPTVSVTGGRRLTDPAARVVEADMVATPPPAPDPHVEPPAPSPVTSVVATVRPEPKTAPLPARRNATGDRSLTRVLGLKLGRVVLDPGHGGYDVGTHGLSGLYEKEVVLDVAHRLGALLDERLGSEVIYTRSDDTYIPLEERTRIANDRKADLFLSIHANSSPYRTVAGVETYYLNFTTSQAALDVAARENASSARSVFDLKDLLQQIALKDKIDESREFATRLQASLYGIAAKGSLAVKNRGIKKAPFVVLIGASMPSVLAEIGFLTNAGDEALLRRSEHRQKIAEALYKGIAGYAETLSHFQVAKRD